MGTLTPTQLEYFGDHLPLVAARRHYPIAKLEATLLNSLGGKPDPNEKNKTKPKPEHLSYTPEERLPWYARFTSTNNETTGALSTEAARALLGNTDDLPSWALGVAPIGEARQVIAAQEKGGNTNG